MNHRMSKCSVSVMSSSCWNHNDDARRQHDFEWSIEGCFTIHSVKPTKVLVVFVVGVHLMNFVIQDVPEVFC